MQQVKINKEVRFEEGIKGGTGNRKEWIRRSIEQKRRIMRVSADRFRDEQQGSVYKEWVFLTARVLGRSRAEGCDRG